MDGFSLANDGQFAKLSCYTVMVTLSNLQPLGVDGLLGNCSLVVKEVKGFVEHIGALLLLQYSVHCLLLNLLHVIHL